MPLIRCSTQQKLTLEEFYIALAESNDAVSRNTSTAMLSIIDFLNTTFTKTKIYGLTSLSHLLLLAKDDDKTKRYIKFITDGVSIFYVEYAMPEHEQPWADAIVKGEAGSMEELKKFIITAMIKSEGWMGNKELQSMT